MFINLERSVDRRERFTVSAKQEARGCFYSTAKEKGQTLQVERLIAVDGKEIVSPIQGVTNNEYACIQSHLNAIKQAKERGYECIAIFEDDITFVKDFKAKFEKYLNQLPKDWHILYLGGSFGRNPFYFNQYFTQQNQTWGAFAYIVHKRAYNNLIEMLSCPKKIVDGHYIDYQKSHLCIKPNERLVIHPKGFSTIKEIEVNYKGIQ